MAAPVSAWSKPGKWALDSEEHEDELLQQKPEPAQNGGVSTDFPSLSASATTKAKKKKGQPISLAEFSGYGSAKKSIFDEAPLALPSGPRERTAEELDRSQIGGGFRSYGVRGCEDSSSRWGSGRGSDEERKSEADDWGAKKKLTMGSGFERRDRDRERGRIFNSQSRDGEPDSWVSSKSSVARYGGFEKERRVGLEREVSNGGGADSDSWGRKRDDNGPVSNGRPRLVLQPRTLRTEAVVIVPKAKTSNPFGEARPREEVLAEKGHDWKEIEEKLETIKIKEPVEKVERGDRLSFGGGKSSFGSRNGRAKLTEERDDRSWRNPETGDAQRFAQ